MADLNLQVKLKGVDEGLQKTLLGLETSLKNISEITKGIDFSSIAKIVKNQTSSITSSVQQASSGISKLDSQLAKLEAKTLTLNPKNGQQLFTNAVDKFTSPKNIIGQTYGDSVVKGLGILIQADKAATNEMIKNDEKRTAEEKKLDAEVTKFFIDENNKRLSNYKKFLTESKSFAEKEAKDNFKIKQEETKKVSDLILSSNKNVVAQVQRLGNSNNLFTKGGNSTLSEMSQFYTKQAKEAISATKELEKAQGGLFKGFKEGLTSGALGRGFVSGAGFAAGLATIRALVDGVRALKEEAEKAGEGFRKLDNSLREIKSLGTIVDDTELNKVRDTIVDIANKYGTDLKQQTEAFYTTVSNGIRDTAQATEVIDAANKLSLAGLGDVNKSTTLITDALNVLNPVLGENQARTISASEAADLLFNAVNFGKIRVDELTSSLGKLIPLGSTLGISLEEMTAALASLTTQGLTTRERTVQLQGVFNQLIKQQDKLKEIGLPISEIKKLGFPEYMNRLEKATRGSIGAIADIFTNIRALQGVIGLTGNGLERYNKTLEDFRKSNNASATAAAELEKSLDFQRKVIENTYDSLQAKNGSFWGKLFNDTKRWSNQVAAFFQGFGSEYSKVLLLSGSIEELQKKLSIAKGNASRAGGGLLGGALKSPALLDSSGHLFLQSDLKNIKLLEEEISVKKIEQFGNPDSELFKLVGDAGKTSGKVFFASFNKALQSKDLEGLNKLEETLLSKSRDLAALSDDFKSKTLTNVDTQIPFKDQKISKFEIAPLISKENVGAFTQSLDKDTQELLTKIRSRKLALGKEMEEYNKKKAKALEDNDVVTSATASSSKSAKSAADTYIDTLQKELGKQAKNINLDKVNELLLDKLRIRSDNNLAVKDISQIISSIKGALDAGLVSPSLEGQATYLEKLIGADKIAKDAITQKAKDIQQQVTEVFSVLPSQYDATKGNALIDTIIDDPTLQNKIALLTKIDNLLFRIRGESSELGLKKIVQGANQGLNKIAEELPESVAKKEEDALKRQAKQMEVLKGFTEGVTDALFRAADASENFGQALTKNLQQVAKQILETYIKTLILNSVLKAFSTKSTDVSGVTNISPSRFSSISQSDISAVSTLATGGEVHGLGSGTSDSNLVALSSGEAVLTARSTKALKKTLGGDIINKLNRLGGGDFGAVSILSSIANLGANLDGLGHYASGGEVANSSFPSATQTAGVKIINNTSTPIQQDNVITRRTLEGMVTEIIISDQRSNGSINKSMKSSYGLSQRGVF